MRKQIRKGVFETNSSSTHVISICKTPSLKLMEREGNQTVEFNGGEFGWDFKLYTDVQSKADYLWTGIVDSGIFNHETIHKIQANIEETLNKYRIISKFQPYKISKYSDGSHEYCEFDSFCYVDHAYCLGDFLNAMFPNNGEDIDEDLFLSYLFNRNSYIETGNDNASDDECPYFNYPPQGGGEIVEFYKGN